MKDLRIVKTERIIKEAFISLVEEKGYAKVSIKDIAKKALINRNTFYLHYTDKEDLVEKMISEIFIEQSEKIKEMNKECSKIDIVTIRRLLNELLSVIYEEIEFYRIILLDSNLSGFLNSLKSELEKAMVTYFSLDYEKHHLEIDYVFFGMIGIVTQWVIMDNAKISQIVDILCTIAIDDMKNCVINF